MEHEVRITVDGQSFRGCLHEEENPKTVTRILNVLPLEARPQQWGDEFYFEIPVNLEIEQPSEHVSVGDIAYWPEGNALCIFFGPTPASTDDRPKPASPVSVVGQIEQATALRRIEHPSEIQVELLQ